ncbi:hypothetical protein EGT74_20310 [Chitinophaga lutea]|uniref:Uncharacterized protein n=1 Tax=Chitinophaga lutea TaxID=2488634 RepID=A0A3N4PKY5_9BACT|nr:hypothetical protein EGT74_20310 [Chitinophaga lutea]
MEKATLPSFERQEQGSIKLKAQGGQSNNLRKTELPEMRDNSTAILRKPEQGEVYIPEQQTLPNPALYLVYRHKKKPG